MTHESDIASRGVSPRPSTNTAPNPAPRLADPRAQRLTHWHITFGTYAARLHGDQRPTVDRQHNTPGAPFVGDDPARSYEERQSLRDTPIYLTLEDRCLIERTIPELCERGDWFFRACAAGPDHVHVLLAAPPETHGKQVRHWLKRWLSQELSRERRRRRPTGAPWWAEGGSTKPVKTEDYFARAYRYIVGQRASLVVE